MEDIMTPTDNITPPSGGSNNEEYEIDIVPHLWIDVDEVPVKDRTPIPMVRNAMRCENLNKVVLKWAEPSKIPVGPYHCRCAGGYDWEPKEEQKLKTGHAQMFIDESGQRKNDLYLKIKKKTPELRDWYELPRQLSDSEMATIFLVDGCFVLNFINYSSKENGFADLGLTNSEMANMKQDLFLLENQLPYPVLQLLFEGAKTSSPSMEEKIKNFVVSHVPCPRRKWGKEVMNNPPSLHLLQYMHAILSGKPKRSTSPPRQRDNDEQTREGGRTNWRSRRTVQEFMEVGIYFKPSATSCLTDISFTCHEFGTSGCLRLPIISINTSTMITFLNLIAFESSNPTSNELEVISYLCFMDSLIDSWDDVKELQAAGVLRNFVGEPKDVAQFFNTVSNELVPNHCAYKDVIEKIECYVCRHCSSNWLRWYVELKQKYFRSPWSCIALIAAIIALCLTAIQTITSFFPR